MQLTSIIKLNYWYLTKDTIIMFAQIPEGIRKKILKTRFCLIRISVDKYFLFWLLTTIHDTVFNRRIFDLYCHIVMTKSRKKEKRTENSFNSLGRILSRLGNTQTSLTFCSLLLNLGIYFDWHETVLLKQVWLNFQHPGDVEVNLGTCVIFAFLI